MNTGTSNISAPRALLTLDDISGAAEVAAALIDLGWEVIATAETVEELGRRDLPATPIEAFIGATFEFDFPPTLHPKIEAALSTQARDRIDLVFCLPYPLSTGMDVGGHTLMMLAAKGHRLVCSSYQQIRHLLDILADPGRRDQELDAYRETLRQHAIARMSEHFRPLLEPGLLGPLGGAEVLQLEAGENPYQHPAHLHKAWESPYGWDKFEVLSAENPCFVNAADSDALLHCLLILGEALFRRYQKTPYISIAGKHGNPCGLAISWDDPAQSINGALFGNPLAIWGGEFVCNFQLDRGLARKLVYSARRKRQLGHGAWMLDVVIAAGISPPALSSLQKRARRTILVNPALVNCRFHDEVFAYRVVRGGILRQPSHHYILDCSLLQQSPEELHTSMIIAWACAFSSNHGGNEVALSRQDLLLNCAGGPSTVDACQTAVARARATGHGTRGSSFAADAFLPFPDAARVLVDAGCVAGLYPQGGQLGQDVLELFSSAGVQVSLLSPEHRGFIRH